MKKQVFLSLVFALMAMWANAQSITFERTYGTVNRDYGVQVLALPDSGFVFVGGSVVGLNNDDIFFYRLNKYGDTLWLKTIGGINGDGPAAIVRTADNGFFITANTSSYGIDAPNSANWYAIKTDANGNIQWTQT